MILLVGAVGTDGEVEEVSQTLARALGLIHPGHRSLRELAGQVVAELERAEKELERLERHECGDHDDGECHDCDDTAATVKRAIEILEELT